MVEILSQVGLFSIFLLALYIIKKVTDYHYEKDEGYIIYKFEEDEEI